MELKWLLDFVSLANTGSFSQTAKERNVTQSAVSRRIQALEHWLGTELVDRKSHPLTLTDSGIRFLEPAEIMIRLAYKVKDDFSDNQIAARDTLTFSSSTHLAISFLPRWLMHVRKGLGPFNVKVQTDISGIHDHFENLRNLQSDFLLHYGHGISTLAMDASKFGRVVIGEDVLVPVCQYELQASENYTLPSSGDQPLPYISPWHTSPIAKLIADRAAQTYPPAYLDTLVESSIVDCTKGFVAQGVGVAWLPRSAIEDELACGEFAQIGDASYEIPLPIEIFRYSSNTKPTAMRFWKHVESQYE